MNNISMKKIWARCCTATATAWDLFQLVLNLELNQLHQGNWEKGTHARKVVRWLVLWSEHVQ